MNFRLHDVYYHEKVYMVVQPPYTIGEINSEKLHRMRLDCHCYYRHSTQ